MFSDLDILCSGYTFTYAIGAILIALLYYSGTRRPNDIPPGPPIRVPILGNIPSLVGKDTLQVFREMRTKYGDIFSMYTGNKLLVVLNGYATIKEALVKHGNTLNGRPQNPLLVGAKGETGIIFSSGSFWRSQRKFVVTAIQQIALNGTSFEDRIMTEVRSMLELLGGHDGSSAFDIQPYLDSRIANVVFGFGVGKRFRHDDEEFQAYLNAVQENARSLAKVGLLINCFPWLRYIPRDPFRITSIQKNSEFVKGRLLKGIYQEHVDTFSEDDIRDMLDLYIMEIKKRDSTEENAHFTYRQLLSLIGDILGAGTETTVTTVKWLLLYLIHNQEIQTRLRRHIKDVVGFHRHPSLTDRKHLPYAEAIIYEGMRIANVAPLALPHAIENRTDHIIRGLRIPADATILVNLDSIFIDDELFDNPREFRPERFLDAEGNIKKPEEFIPFGIGRRICVGEIVAKAELFLFLTTLIQNYVFLPENDDTVPDYEGILGITYSPKSYLVRVTAVP